MSPATSSTSLLSAIFSSSRRFVACILLFAVPSFSTSPESITDAVWASKTPEEHYKSSVVQWISLSCSILSAISCLVVLFWFYRMEKRFRHRLIMILMCGDLIKGVWFMISACVFLGRGSIPTASGFCQSSGFFIQFGTQISDYAILVMAMHSAIEVFYPSTLVSSDGLYPWRHFVYVGAIAVPTLMAGLAFVNPNSGYWVMGAYCMLPIRPFWYRLALTWIARYIIVLLIIGLAIAIYIHVGFEFRRCSTVSESIKLSVMEHHVAMPEALQNTPRVTITEDGRRTSSMTHDILSSNHSPFLSVPNRPALETSSNRTDTRSILLPEDPSAASPRPEFSRHTLLSILSGSSLPAYPNHIRTPAGSDEEANEGSWPEPPPREPPVDAQAARQRRFIARQLRLLFIYPLVYTIMWLIPFVQHCTFYQDKWAEYPMYGLRIANILCITLMGFVDCIVFSMREKPWRSINSSDGTFWGSLSFRSPHRWDEDRHGQEHCAGRNEGPVSIQRAMAEGPSVGRFRTGAKNRASDDFSRIAANWARVRLNLEREERNAWVRRESAATDADPPGSDPPIVETSPKIDVGGKST